MRYIPHLRVIALSMLATLASISSAQPYSTPRMFGANIAGGDFDNDYWYPRQDDIDHAKSLGAELIRVPFKWQRIHHDTTPGVLDATLWEPDMVQLDASIDAMEARGMRIILDMHNYGGRELNIGGVPTVKRIGSPELPVSEFARTWRLIADRYKNRASIWGYDLMNEPTSNLSMAELTQIYQAGVDAIREVDLKHSIIIEGRGNNHASAWLTAGAPFFDPVSGVIDPMNNLIASAHCYTDNDQSGRWREGNGSVQAELVSTGKYPDLASAYNVGVDRIKPFVDWCVANNVRGMVGEYTIPGRVDTANWDIVSERLMAYMRDNGNGLISGTQWSAGGIGHNQQRMMPRVDNSKPPSQKTFLPSYFSGIGTNYWTRFIWYGGSGDKLQSTGGTNYAYVFPSSSDITINLANHYHAVNFPNVDPATIYSGTNSIHIHWALPTGTYGGGGLHTGGPNAVNYIGGIDLSSPIAAGQALILYARGTPGSNLSVTIASTSDATNVDTQVTGSATITQTGNYVSLGSIEALDDTYTRYEIPLSSFLNSSLDGSRRAQRLLFLVGPSDGTPYDVYVDSITLNTPTNTAPTVTVDTSTGGTSFTNTQTITLVATASDVDPGDGIDYVEFYANHAKVGIDDTAPYQYSTTLPARTYDLTAIAYDSHGVPKQSTVKTITVTNPALVPPATAPTNVTVVGFNTKATIKWFGVPEATYYNVKRATAPGGPFVTVASPAGISYTDTGLVNNTTYYYVVSAANAAGESANSAAVSVVPLPPPPGPAVLNATVGSQRVALSWSAVSTALSYNIKRSTVSGGPYTMMGTSSATYYSDSTVVDGTTYYYVVSATNNSGESADSVELSVTPQAATTIIKDNSDATGIAKTGSWSSSTNDPDYYPPNYWHDGNTGLSGGTKKVVFTPTIGTAGVYDVYGRWPAASGRATNVPFDINYAGGALETRTMNQTDTSNNGKWVYLGTYPFATGTAGNVTIRNASADGFVIADAVQFVAAPEAAVITLSNLSATYDGSPKAATVTTAPSGLSVSLSYDGSATAPTAAGSYKVVATVTSAGYVGNVATGTLVITQPPVEIIVDNPAAEFSGTWNTSSFQANEYLSNYRTRNSGGTGANKMRWRPTITAAGTYQVYYWLPDGASNRASNAPFTVYYSGGSYTYFVDERPVPGGQWILLGSHPFAAGTTGYVELTDNADGVHLIGDAIRFYKP